MSSADQEDGRRKDLSPRFREHVALREFFPRGSHLLVGVSGRCDSIALLHLLQSVALERRLTLTAAHVERTKNQGDAADATLVQNHARNLGIPFLPLSDDTPEESPGDRPRRVRMLLTRATAFSSARIIATGETLDDHAEYLLDVLTGDDTLSILSPDEDLLTAEDSLPRDETVRFVRPLLPFTHEECRTFLDAQKLRYRHNEEALQLSSPRSRLRLLVLPLLSRHVNTRSSQNLAAATELLGDDEGFLRLLSKAARREVHWSATKASVAVSYPRWKTLPAALRRRMLDDAARIALSAPEVPSPLGRAPKLSRHALLSLDLRCRRLPESAALESAGLKIRRENGRLNFTRSTGTGDGASAEISLTP